jgi:hypothetical protein
MTTDFQILPISEEAFAHLMQLNDEELALHHAVRQTVDVHPGFPCRFTLEDALIGEEVLLFPYLHVSAEGPYRASGPIFVRPGAKMAALAVNQVPRMLELRAQSIRGYDADGMMIAATVVEGEAVKPNLQKFFENPLVAEVHLHNAKPGCFNCRAVRA